MTQGVYKITNNINNNIYVGISVNIESRWKSHIQRYTNKECKEYDKALYRAFRKHGVENFTFEIIETIDDIDLMKEREKYWIKEYDSYHSGYNETTGEDMVNMGKEKHPNHKLTVEDVIYIRKLWASKTISTREMYYEYSDKIGKSGFKKIYNWETWKDILPELNTQENRDWHRNNLESYTNREEKASMTVLSKEDFKEIKERYLNGETLKDIFPKFKDCYADYSSFYASWYKKLKNENLWHG